MSFQTVTSVDSRTIEQADHTETHSKRTIFAQLRRTFATIPWAFLGILPVAHFQDPVLSSPQPPGSEAVDFDWPLFYECCDFSFYWVY